VTTFNGDTATRNGAVFGPTAKGRLPLPADADDQLRWYLDRADVAEPFLVPRILNAFLPKLSRTELAGIGPVSGESTGNPEEPSPHTGATSGEAAPTTRPSASNDLGTLQKCWQQWTSVVEIYASGSRRRGFVNDADYCELHTRLLQVCRSLAEQANPDQRSFYESLQELAKPWLTPRILGRTSDRFLADLLASCLRAEKQLTGTERPRRSGRRLVPVLLILAAGAGLGLIALGLNRLGGSPSDWLRQGPNAIWRAVLGATLAQRIVFGGIVLAAAAIGVLARSRRR
jgi:hypothetical protein